MKLPSFFRQTNNDTVNIVVSLSLILSFIASLWISSARYHHLSDPLNAYEYSEFLINFQGGFVRRGLIGEFLYNFYQVVPFPIVTTITIISFAAFLFVLYYFIRQFYKKKYCWWLICSPIIFGMTFYFVRKDFILYAILIGCFCLLRNSINSIYSRFLAFMLLVLGLFLHEAFMFFSFPIYALILFSFKNNKYINWLLIILPIIIFFVLCGFKGDVNTALVIIDSWNNILPGSPLIYTQDNSIGALGWDTLNAFKFHISKNMNVAQGGYGIILIPVAIFTAYYMLSNFLKVFNPYENREAKSIKFRISLLYPLSILCLLPMFTILSCDIGRVFQYSTVSTLCAFLIFPKDMILEAFPQSYKRFIIKVNYKLERFLPPSKGLLLLILFFFGMSPFWFSIMGCWYNSIVGELLQLILRISHLFRLWLVPLFL